MGDAKRQSSIFLFKKVSHSACLEALVMTHEALDIECTWPYHAARLRPLPVLELVGRTRDFQPKCKDEASVWSWWKDLTHCLSEKSFHFTSSFEVLRIFLFCSSHAGATDENEVFLAFSLYFGVCEPSAAGPRASIMCDQ